MFDLQVMSYKRRIKVSCKSVTTRRIEVKDEVMR